MTLSFSPRDSLLQVYRNWWLVVCLGILGGLFGWLIHKTQTPIYQASVAFTVTIDTAQTGPLTEREYDRLQQSFANVFFSREIIEKTLQAAAARSIPIDRPAFNSATSYEWNIAFWEFYIRHPDPIVAQGLAEVWGNTAVEELTVALRQAQEAQTLQNYIRALVTCDDEFADVEAPADCTLPAYENIEGEIAVLDARREEAVQKSRSLIPAMAFEQTKHAELPSKPITTGQAQIVFYSALIGMAAGIWLVNLRGFHALRLKK